MEKEKKAVMVEEKMKTEGRVEETGGGRREGDGVGG